MYCRDMSFNAFKFEGSTLTNYPPALHCFDVVERIETQDQQFAAARPNYFRPIGIAQTK